MKQKIIQLRGLPASGKTTYANQLLSEFPHIYKRLNKDEMRECIPNFDFKKDEHLVVESLHELAEEYIQQGYSIIDDNTNFNPYHVEFMQNLAKRYNIDYEMKVFDTPVAECIERDMQRTKGKVGVKVILEMYSRYLLGNGAKLKSGIDPEPYENDSTLPPCIIVDLDGTSAKSNGRGFYDETKVIEDSPIEPIFEIVRRYAKDTAIIFMSGRTDGCYDDTSKWLNTYSELEDFKLYMRKAGDARKDSIVKKELFDEHIKGKYYVRFVLDDRSQVVDMWRNTLKLTTLQVADGDF